MTRRTTSGHGLPSRLHCAAFFGLIVGASPSAVFAQPVVAQVDAEEEAAKVDEKSHLVATSGPVDREASGFGGGGGGFVSPALELSSSGDSVVGTLALGYSNTDASFADTKKPGEQKVSAQSFKFGLEATVPFNGSGKDDVIDFRNIGNDAEMTVTATWFGTSYLASPDDDLNINRAYRQCVAQALKDTGIDGVKNFLTELDALLAADSTRYQTAETSVRKLAPEGSPIFAAVNEPCFDGIGDETIFRKYGAAANTPDAYRQTLRRITGGSLKFFGAQASFGYGTHNVLNRAAFGLDKENRVGIDGRVYAGIISDDGRKSARISLGYARGYEARDSVNFCRPDTSGTGQTCISGEDGRPVRSENSYVSVEGRLGFGKVDVGPPQFAIAPQVTYRVEDKDFLFDLPVYLVRKADTGLSGGIRAAYDTGKDDFTMRVFVGVPFSTWF